MLSVVINTNLEKKTTFVVDQSATLSITVSGEDIDYQWQVGKFIGNPDGSLWNDVPNASGTLTGLNTNHVLQFSFTASESMDGRFYRCVLSNDVSNTISEETQIDVIEKPVIDVQPKSVNVATGKNATFSVSVSGVILTYRWQEKPVDGSWTNIEEDADDRFYILKATKVDTGKEFRCIIRNEAGYVISNSATLTVLDAPVITTDLIVPAVENGSTVELTVTATGDAIQYQWESSSDNRSTWVPITNDSDIPNTYSFTATENQNGNYYRCIVSNLVGSISSSEQKLTVITLPSIVTQPKSVSIGRGEVATFQVTVSGDVSGYQWQVYTSETSAWMNVPENGNTAVYSVTADMAMSGNRYRCWISNPLNSSKIKTNTVTLAVFNPIIIISPSSDYVVNANIDEQATFSVEATGDDLSYQWQYYDSSAEKWRSGSGATDTSYTTTATEARNGRQYRCKVYNDYLTVYSPIARLNVVIPPPPIITTEPASTSVGLNKPATFSVEVSNPPVTYQWQVSTDNGSTWINVPDGGTEASYRIDEASSEMDDYQYRCILTNTRGETTSNAAVLSIIPVPVIVRQPASVSAMAGSTITFSVQANGEQLKYQWQYSKNGGSTWKNAPSSNASAKTNAWTLTVIATYDNYRFRCVISNPSSTGIATETASITISAPPEITKDISSVTVNEGDSVSFSINATGGDLNYQWQVSINNGRDWINVSNNGNTSAYSVTANANQNQNQFRCKVWNALGEVYSNNAIVSIRSKPQITVQPRPVTAVYGVLATFVVVAEGGELTYQWQRSTDDGETWENIKGEKYTKPAFSVPATDYRNGRQYRCIVTNEAGSTISDAAVFTTFESSGYEDDDNSDDQEQYTDRYLPSEMAEAIRRIKSGFSVSEADNGKVVSNGSLVEQTAITVTENGTFDTTTNNSVTVDVPTNETINDDYIALIDGTITEVTNNAKKIRSQAFYGCSSLVTAIFPECTTIGSCAFDKCYRLTTASFPKCTTIGSSAFYTCSSLTTVNFPECITIHTSAFLSCSSLTTINFPKCTTIGSYAFDGCYRLMTASFPECITIGPSAFRTCSRLTTINFPECIAIHTSAFFSCSSLTTASFPKCTTMIGSWAFAGCYRLTTASFPECTIIGPAAFYTCSSLTTVNFPKCTTIGSSVFFKCANLTAVSFSECTTISYQAFRSCSSLTTISFPKCSAIGNYAFYGCSNLTAASFPECTTIGPAAFDGCSSLTTVNFPKCTTIGTNAFYGCSNLTAASFPECTTIGSSTFYGCQRLSSLYLFGSSVCRLTGPDALALTAIASGNGWIYVPSSLYSAYISASYWSYYSSRFYCGINVAATMNGMVLELPGALATLSSNTLSLRDTAASMSNNQLVFL